MDTRKILENLIIKSLNSSQNISQKISEFFPQIFVIIKQSTSILPIRDEFPVRRPICPISQIFDQNKPILSKTNLNV